MVKPTPLTLVALRHTTRHPIQSLLLVLGVALGVAMILAIDLANSSASQAFALSTDSIAGKATHQITTQPNGVPTSVYETMRVQLGLQKIAPVVTGQAVLEETGGEPLRLLGVDPFAEAPFRNYLGSGENGVSLDTLTPFLLEPGTIFIAQSLGERYNLTPGQTLTLSTEDGQKPVRLIGLLQPSDDLSRRAISDLVLTDISTAQELLNQEGYLSNIDLILPEEADLQPILDLLPENAQLQRASLRNETVDQLTNAFELNLTALSLLGVVVGMFLIYNTISFSVVQRRPILGTLRCLGVTRREIFSLVLAEALFLSLIGTIIGLGLGIVLGRGLVGLVAQTINDLFFSVSVQDVTLQPLSIYKGVAAGLSAGLVAAAVPALEATTVPPSSALKRSVAETRVQKLIPWLSLVGLLMILGSGGLLAIPTQSLVISFTALFLIIIGVALLTPYLTKVFMVVLSLPLKKGLGILGVMAPRDIIRALSRTSVTIAALMVAVSVIIGISIMIGSFRNTVIEWLNTILIADIYITPAGLGQEIDPTFIDQLIDYPGVEAVEMARITTVSSPDYGPVLLNAFSAVDEAERRTFLWLNGTPDQANNALAEGQVFVSEVFARQHNLPLNRPSEIALITSDGPRSFTVSGIFYHYDPQGFVLMNLRAYQRLWNDPIVSSVGLYVTPETNTDEAVVDLRDRFAATYQLTITANRGIKQSAITVFDRTFTITAALRLLATIVAFIGVLSAIMSLQLERTRELGTLRANGMTLRQLWGLTLLETGLMGTAAGLISIPTGLIMAIILIYVINLRSFGWSLQLQLNFEIFLVAMLVAIVASLLAGIYPSLRLNKMEIAAALREE